VTVVVRLASGLRVHAGGAPCVAVEVAPPVTVGAVLDALADAHPAVGRRVRDEGGGLRRHVNVFVGPDNTRDVEGLATPVPDGVEVAVLPAVSGG
jgi:molybdopterin synthase sulfur carrier subunit